MRVLLTAADDSSGHYRVRLPVSALRDDNSIDAQVVPEKIGLPLIVNRVTGEFVDIELDCDVLVLQRPMFELMPQVIDCVQAKGIAVVIELDDDFHTAHPNNRAFHLNHPTLSPRSNWKHLGECIKRADLVTVSTDQLARRYGSHGRVVVLRNYVDPEILDIKRRHRRADTIGWAGTVVNHPLDLRATRGGVGMALRENSHWRFLCAGGASNSAEIMRQLEIDSTRFMATEWRRLELHRLVVSLFDVGIAPLADTVFNAAKSWLKGLEYAAMGIPFVASDLPEYELLQARYGLGLLASARARDWRRSCQSLMNDPSAGQLGEHYRAIVADYLTIDRHVHRWTEAWEQAVENRKSRTEGVSRDSQRR
jgi:hypothetical protein